MLNYNEPCNMKAFDVYPVSLFKKAGYTVHTQVPGVHWLESKKADGVRVYIHIKVNNVDKTLCRIEVKNITVSDDYAKIKELFDGITYNYVPKDSPKNFPNENIIVKKCIPKIILSIPDNTQIIAPIEEICDIIDPTVIFDGTLNFD